LAVAAFRAEGRFDRAFVRGPSVARNLRRVDDPLAQVLNERAGVLVIPLAKAEREWLRGPLSKETTYRPIVSGELGPKEIGKLIKMLQAQKAVLSDDDDEKEEAAN